MKKFLKKILLFAIPFLLLVPVIIWFVYVGYSTGELKEIDSVIASQRKKDKSLLGLGYNEQNAYYKMANANYYQADIIAVGTSRVMQFRKNYFTKPFYNCGGGANTNFDSYLNFVKNLQYKPKVIILGLDCWVFNDNWNRGLERYDNFKAIEKVKRPMLTILRALITDWIQKKWTRETLDNYPKNMGINGLVKNNGFRNDGSYCYGDIYLHPEQQQDYQFKDTISRINNGVSRFEYGDEVDSDSVKMLYNFLSYCKDRGIYVIGFTAPLAPSIYERMELSGNYTYIDGIARECERVFDENGFNFYDYLNGASLEYGDEHYVDGFHGGDIVYAEIARRIFINDDRFSGTVDFEKIDKLIGESNNNLSLDVYD